MARPKNVSSGDTWQQIVNAANRVFTEDAPHGITLRRVASEAGVSLGTLTHYFATRDQLIDCFLKQLHDRYQAIYCDKLRRWRRGADPWRLVEQSVRETFRAARDFRGLLSYRIGCLVSGDLDHRSDPLHLPLMAVAQSLLTDVLGLPPPQVMLVATSITYLIGRYAMSPVEELVRWSGIEEEESDWARLVALRQAEDHLVWMVRRLVGSVELRGAPLLQATATSG